MESLISFTEKGIYCPAGDFFIDPWKPVPYAVITHAHADHSRWGNKNYLAHTHSAPVMKQRLGSDINLQTAQYGETIFRNGVKVSLHPAGHIIGSAQVRMEYKGQVCVVSGDYKTEADATCAPFEPVICHEFLTESTFGLPVYCWQSEETLFQEVNQWWKNNKASGKNSVLFGYALGKAQRILSGLDPSIGDVYVHGAVWNVNQAFGDLLKLPYAVKQVDPKLPKSTYQGAMIIAPPSAMGTSWMRRFQPYVTGMGSGWMAVRGMKRRRSVDTGFIISDHADWPGLNAAVKATRAEKVYVTHGYAEVFSRHLREQGIDAQVVETLFEGDGAEDGSKEGL